jgi:HNH endonuclease
MTRAKSTEEPCASKETSTVLKTSERGDPLAEFDKIRHQCAYRRDESPCDHHLEVEHLIPLSRGGANRVSNLTIACPKHNQEKGNKTAAEYGFSEVEAQAKRPLKDAAAVNATRWALFDRLKGRGLPLKTGSGGLTKFNRTQKGLAQSSLDRCGVRWSQHA